MHRDVDRDGTQNDNAPAAGVTVKLFLNDEQVATTTTDAEGNEHQVSRPVVALCVCGRSGSAPWCDGTHKLLRQGPS